MTNNRDEARRQLNSLADALTREGKPNILGLSADRKRALVEKFASDAAWHDERRKGIGGSDAGKINDNNLREKLTMAARNVQDLEADIDSFLEDLVELGVIDEDGNIR